MESLTPLIQVQPAIDNESDLFKFLKTNSNVESHFPCGFPRVLWILFIIFHFEKVASVFKSCIDLHSSYSTPRNEPSLYSGALEVSDRDPYF